MDRSHPDMEPEEQGARAEAARLEDENALLRAALADTRARLGEAQQAAERDPLTGLADRDALVRHLERAVAKADRHGTPSALLTIDVKGLAALNRSHGRVAGDAALVHVARLLRDLIRASDVAARLDGGFAVLLDHLDPDSAVEAGERIARLIADRPLDLGASLARVDVTVGAASILPGDDVADLLSRAERNRQRVKQF